MNLSMFMMFVKQFHILGQDTRQPTDKNDLEKKRRGLPGKIDQHVKQFIDLFSLVILYKNCPIIRMAS